MVRSAQSKTVIPFKLCKDVPRSVRQSTNTFASPSGASHRRRRLDERHDGVSRLPVGAEIAFPVAIWRRVAEKRGDGSVTTDGLLTKVDHGLELGVGARGTRIGGI